jgi:hypothetical protein
MRSAATASCRAGAEALNHAAAIPGPTNRVEGSADLAYDGYYGLGATRGTEPSRRPGGSRDQVAPDLQRPTPEPIAATRGRSSTTVTTGSIQASAPMPEATDQPPTGGRGHVIWFVNQYAGSPDHGMEFRHYELGQALAARGHTVAVISGTYSHLFSRPPETLATYAFETLDRVTYCWVRVPPYERAVSLGRVLNMLAFMARLYRLPVRRRRPGCHHRLVSVAVPDPAAERWHADWGGLVRGPRPWPLTLQELGGTSRWHPGAADELVRAACAASPTPWCRSRSRRASRVAAWRRASSL